MNDELDRRRRERLTSPRVQTCPSTSLDAIPILSAHQVYPSTWRRFVKTIIILLAVLSLAGTCEAGLIRRPRAIKSDARSPVLTSVTELKTTVEYGTVELVVTGLTAAGKKASITEELECWPEDEHHLKYMSDPRDGYWTACYRLILGHEGKMYIVGYEEQDGDSDSDDTDISSSYGADIPFDFDLATQTFRIRMNELVPLPDRFRQRDFTGVRFLVPVNLRGLSKGEAEAIIRNRGGLVVNSAGPVDVVVLPDRIDLCPNSGQSRNRLADRWFRKGAKVLWERTFGRPNAPPDCGVEGDWRD